jgi:cytochrome d ubiquinol oxidase subunit II
LWDYAFHFGSPAAFMQGMMLGAFVQALEVDRPQLCRRPLDWLNAFSVMTGLALVFGYALLGATWLVMKTDGETQDWARKSAGTVDGIRGFFMGMVSLSMPLMNSDIKATLVQPAQFLLFLQIHAASLGGPFSSCCGVTCADQREYRPFFLSQGIFLMNYIGLGISTVALAGALRGLCPERCGGSGIPVPIADRNGRLAALRVGLHRLLFLGLQGQGLPRT